MSTAQGHTPGPWSAKSTADVSKYSKEWREISPGVVTAASYDTNRWGEIETIPGVRITEADARLIAAAPQMFAVLERLKHVQFSSETLGLANIVRAEVCAAIAAATATPQVTA